MAALRFHIGCCLILWWSPILVPAAEVAKARTDAYGDPLPNGALARLGTVRFRLPHWSYSLALSPDGKLLAATAGNDTIGLIDTATGLQVRQIKIGITGGRGGLFFSPDSTRLATIGFQGIEVHDINTGNEFATSAVQYRGGSASLAFSADGKLLAVGGDGLGTKSPIKVWNLETKKEVASLDVLHNINVQVALSADGKVLANWGQSSRGGTQDSSILQLWDVAKGKELRQIEVESYLAANAAFSPNGKHLAVLEVNSSLGIWDVASGTQLRRLATRRGSGAVLRYSPDGKVLVVGTDDGVIQTWDTATGKRLAIRSGPGYRLVSLVFAGDKMLAAGLKNQAICVWEPSSGLTRSPKGEPTATITGLAFSAGGKALIAAADNVRWWDMATGKTSRQFTPPDDSNPPPAGLLPFMLAPEGKYLATGRQHDSGLRIMELAKGEELCDLPVAFDHKRPLVSAFAGDGRTFAAQSQVYRMNAQSSVVRVWDLSSGAQRLRLDAKGQVSRLGAQANQLALSPDGRWAALAANSQERAGNAGTIQLWDLSTGKETVKIQLDGWTTALAFSTDGTTLAAACGQQGLYFLDTATGARLRTLDGAGATFWNRVQFSPDGRLLAAVSSDTRGQGSGKVALWELASGKVRAEFTGHRGSITALAFAPDTRTLATGSDDTTVLLWDLVGRLGQTPDTKLTAKELASLWDELDGDAVKAHQAMVRLTAAGAATVALLRKQVPPAAGKSLDAKEIDRLVTDLDSDSFETREKASQALEKCGTLARSALLKALAATPSPEKKRRVQELVERAEHGRAGPRHGTTGTGPGSAGTPGHTGGAAAGPGASSRQPRRAVDRGGQTGVTAPDSETLTPRRRRPVPCEIAQAVGFVRGAAPRRGGRRTSLASPATSGKIEPDAARSVGTRDQEDHEHDLPRQR